MKNRIKYWLLALIVLTSCKTEHKGFNLQKFETVNNKLSFAIHIADSLGKIYDKQKTIVLELRISDSIPELKFSYLDSTAICDYIYSNNYRIVGYMVKQSEEIILLSNINDRTKFELTFYDYLKPTNEHKVFRYIYFPDYQYRVNEKGDVFLPYSKEYGGYLIFKYKNNNFELQKPDMW